MINASSVEQNRLITSIYESAYLPQKWGDFFAQFAEQTSAYSVGFAGHRIFNDERIGFAYRGLDPEFVKSYITEYESINPWREAARVAPVGVVERADAGFATSELVKSRFYNEWLRPQEDIRWAAGVNLFRNSSQTIRLSCSLRHKDRERFDDLVSTLKLLTPHLQAALRITDDRLRHSIDGKIADLFSAQPGAVWVLDRQGRACFANGAAERLRHANRIISYGRDGAVFVRDGSAHHAVLKALAAIQNGDVTSLRPIIVHDEAGSAQIIVGPYADPWREENSIDAWFSHSEPMAVLYVPTNAGRLEITDNLTEFALTPTERGLCQSLCAGETLGQYAERRGVSVGTARKQLKSIFSKTGARQQSQLVALLSSRIRPAGKFGTHGSGSGISGGSSPQP